MKSYNGFSASQRASAQAWLNEEYRRGRLERPAVCCACGQTEGLMHAHAEDYSRPFGPHIAEYPLCYTCHMMLHSRFRAPEAWRRYVAQVLAGLVADNTVTANYGRISAYLAGKIDFTWRRRPTEPAKPRFLALLSMLEQTG